MAYLGPLGARARDDLGPKVVGGGEVLAEEADERVLADHVDAHARDVRQLLGARRVQPQHRRVHLHTARAAHDHPHLPDLPVQGLGQPDIKAPQGGPPLLSEQLRHGDRSLQVVREPLGRD